MMFTYSDLVGLENVEGIFFYRFRFEVLTILKTLKNVDENVKKRATAWTFLQNI